MNFVGIDGTMFSPELRYTQSRKPVLTFSLGYRNGKGQDGKSDYGSIRVKAFGALASNAMKKLVERDKIVVCGRLVQEKWEKDGVKYYRDAIIANSIGSSISPFDEDGAPGAMPQDEEVEVPV